MSSKSNNVVTKDLFKLFKDECIKWLNAFGLTDWSVTFSCEGNTITGPLASVQYTPDGLSAHITISKYWEDQPMTKIQIQRCALHEVCHILTARMELLAQERFISEREIMEESEKIARKIEHSIWQWRR